MEERWTPESERDHAMMAVMIAVRSFSDAMNRMHTGMCGEMELNATDLAALRMMVVRERRGEVVTPQQIAHHLGITTASTTALVDRLTARGHVERRPHPSDRRSVVVGLTEHARKEFHHHFGERMRRMRAAMNRYDDEDLVRFAAFLTDMEEALHPPE